MLSFYGFFGVHANNITVNFFQRIFTNSRRFCSSEKSLINMSRAWINKNIFELRDFIQSRIKRQIDWINFFAMKLWFALSLLLTGCFCASLAAAYEESIGDMLSQCNLHQSDFFQANHTKHLCEKPDADDDFSYYITEMKTRYSQVKFMCLLFFKDEHFKLRFKFWFSHANYSVNAVSATKNAWNFLY